MRIPCLQHGYFILHAYPQGYALGYRIMPLQGIRSHRANGTIFGSPVRSKHPQHLPLGYRIMPLAGHSEPPCQRHKIR